MPQIVGILSSLLTFLSPVFYPLSAVPERFQSVLMLNPLTVVIEQVRAALVGDALSASMLGMQFLAGVVTAIVGRAVFKHLRKGFADVV
jgi:lipopolysaccharide transport system permease protein